MLKWVTYDLRLSSSSYVMLSMAVKDLLCLCPPMKCVTKCPLNSLKVETMFGVSLLNHTLASPFNVVGKTLHIISSGIPCKCMRVLNDSKWSSGSRDLLYASICGIRNLTGRGKEVTCAVKGELIRWTSSSKLVDTYPLRALIIMSISSFIVYISVPCATRRLPTQRDDWYLADLVYGRHCFLLGCHFLADHSSGDDCCHVHPYLVCHSDHSTPGHSIALAVIPTRGSAE